MKKLVVITGASSGIGEAVAKRMSQAGHPVLLLARREQILESFNLPDSLCKRVDVTDLNAMKAAIHEAEVEYSIS